MAAFLIILFIVVVGWYLKNGGAPKAPPHDHPITEQETLHAAILKSEERLKAQDLLSEHKIVVKYEHIDTSEGACVYILFLLLCAIPAFFFPQLWSIVIVGFFVYLPITYYSNRKQEKRAKNNEPALTIDGTLLTYNRKTIDLSPMDRAKVYPDSDDDDAIHIYRKGKWRPRMVIRTYNMLIDRDILLKIIQDRIKGVTP